MKVQTHAGETKIVEGVSQPEQGLIIIVNLDGVETEDEWVILCGKTKDAPRSHSMFVGSPQYADEQVHAGDTSAVVLVPFHHG